MENLTPENEALQTASIDLDIELREIVDGVDSAIETITRGLPKNHLEIDRLSELGLAIKEAKLARHYLEMARDQISSAITRL